MTDWSTQTPEIVNELRLVHNRVEVLKRLAGLQILPLIILLAFVVIGNGIKDLSQERLVYLTVGKIGILSIYLFFTAIAILKVLDPTYFTVLKSGQVIWSPFFKKRYFHVERADMSVFPSEVRILPEGLTSPPQLPTRVPLPATIIWDLYTCVTRPGG